VEDGPDRPRVIMRRGRAFVDRERGLDAVIVVVGLPDPLRTAVAPVVRRVREAAAGQAAVARIAVEAGPRREPHLVEEALADLIDGDQLLEARVADADAARAAEAERRVSRHHRRVRVARAEPR